MSRLDELIREYCPEGVEFKALVDLCKIETGKLNANATVENGKYAFFTTAKQISRIDTYAWDAEAIMIAGNANVGDIKYYKGKFNAYQRTYVLTEFSINVQAKFLYYVLKNGLKQYLDSNKNEAAMVYIVLSVLQHFKIPLPPLPVQREIVRILDAFTGLTEDLTAELAERKKQYAYYRDTLLAFDNNTFRILGNLIPDINPDSIENTSIGNLITREREKA